jgi:hypothetical protein
MQIVDALEERLPLQARAPASGEDDRDGLAVVVEALELCECRVGRRAADDLVVVRVALELGGDPLERFWVLVDGEDERQIGHHSGM